MLYAPGGCALTPTGVLAASRARLRSAQRSSRDTTVSPLGEVTGQDGVGLCGQERAPGRSRPARRGITTASCRICYTVEVAMR